jgi:glycosyltransferase involved in cell wall biosynthesis
MNILHATDQHTHAKQGVAFAVNEIMAQTASALSLRGRISLISAGHADLAVPEGTLHYHTQRSAPWSGRWRYTPDYEHLCRRIIREHAVNVVHMHGVWTHPTYAANRAALRCGVPTVLTNHGQLMPWALQQPGALGALKKKAYLGAMNNRLYRSISVLHAITALERDALADLFPRRRIEVIPNSVDLAKIDLVAGRVVPTIGDARYILFVGRLHPQKGVELLIEAFARAQLPRDWRLIIVGPPEDPSYATRVQNAASSSGRAASVEWRGPIWDAAEKYALMRGAWAMVVPSRIEVVGMVNLEAAVCNTPTITTFATGLSDWEEGGGLLVETSADSLTAALTACGRWSDLERTERGLASRKLVEQRYSTAATTPRWVELYGSLC